MTIGRRDRLIYFRISEEEFEQIRKACDARGARSVSDLARAAVQEFISPGRSESERELHEIVKSLSTTLEEIRQGMRQLLSTETATTLAAAASPHGTPGCAKASTDVVPPAPKAEAAMTKEQRPGTIEESCIKSCIKG
jgi:hypothetical protein